MEEVVGGRVRLVGLENASFLRIVRLRLARIEAGAGQDCQAELGAGGQGAS